MRLHLIRGLSAAGTLRQVVRRLGEPRTVLDLGDQPAYGPLASDQERDAWWRTLGSEDDVFVPGVYQRWEVLRRKIADAAPERLVIWTSGETDDHIFLRMACDQLKSFDGGIDIVTGRPWGPPDEQRHGLGMYGPDDMATFITSLREIEPSERERLASEWKLVPQGHGVRVLESGRIELRGYDIWDEALLSYIGADWEIPIRAVGKTLGHHNNLTGQNDTFLMWRIQELVKSGVLELQRPQVPQPSLWNVMRESRVRRIS